MKDEEARLKSAIDNCDQEIKNACVRANEWRKKRGVELYDDLRSYTFVDHMVPMIYLALNTDRYMNY